MDLDDARLGTLAGLLRVRHAIDDEVSTLIGLTPSSGHIGEVVAGAIFDIELEHSRVNPGFDGRFRTGDLAGQTVNVKAYSERGTLLDISPHLCDWYLVLMGPPRTSAEKGRALPFRIDQVYLFEMKTLRSELSNTGVAIGVATSVRKASWEAAVIYPQTPVGSPQLPDERQRRLLALFAGR